ncbi:Cu(I)-responsive transcriptional regulator [Comamonas sp. JUb58]|uniref:Cu(I)-responsive transcriptional regulator n=1 Tax=Comamonas sp. JUb58 TaxID=2485114 RepID=UPI00105B7E87|nr:Cu(I)-responsive transcriptional regulator [Comamonas sp. JUb58]TDS81521.1 Cu(I)-responsive transcriptional regulator [Comamonas sp. JUb58]
MASPSRKPAAERSIAWPVSISKAAQLAGISARMARHYESLNLLPHVNRTDSGYRLYTQSDVHTLSFIRRSRDLGFSMEEIENLLNLWHDKQRASSSVKEIAQKHIETLRERIAAMKDMERSLQALVHSCHGDQRPDCPILDSLSDPNADPDAASCCKH